MKTELQREGAWETVLKMSKYPSNKSFLVENLTAASQVRRELMAIQERMREKDPNFGVKCFSFIPEATVSRKFITIDTKSLRTILSQLIGREEIKAAHHQRNWISPRARAGYQLESSNSRKGSNRKNIATSQQFGDDRVENFVWHAPSEEAVKYKKNDFLSSVDICHVLPGCVFRRWERTAHDRTDQTSYLPRSITTDGIQSSARGVPAVLHPPCEAFGELGPHAPGTVQQDGRSCGRRWTMDCSTPTRSR